MEVKQWDEPELLGQWHQEESQLDVQVRAEVKRWDGMALREQSDPAG
jgi:hypothetical protein